MKKNLVREPDAGNPHVRFDERDVETEHDMASEAPSDERDGTDRPCLNHRATSRLYRYGEWITITIRVRITIRSR